MYESYDSDVIGNSRVLHKLIDFKKNFPNRSAMFGHPVSLNVP